MQTGWLRDCRRPRSKNAFDAQLKKKINNLEAQLQHRLEDFKHRFPLNKEMEKTLKEHLHNIHDWEKKINKKSNGQEEQQNPQQHYWQMDLQSFQIYCGLTRAKQCSITVSVYSITPKKDRPWGINFSHISLFRS